MRHINFIKSSRGGPEGLGVLLVAAASTTAVLLIARDAGSPDALLTTTVTAGLMAGTLLLMGALFCYINLRTTPDPRQGWVVAAVVLVAGQVLLNSALILDPRHEAGVMSGWPLVHQCVTMLVVMALCLAGLRTTPRRVPNPLALGTVLVTVAVTARLGTLTIDTPLSATTTHLLTAVGLTEHVVIGAIVVGHTHLARSARWRLSATIVLIGVGHMAQLGGLGTEGLVASAATTAVAGVIWVSGSFIMLRDALDSQKDCARALEGTLLEIESTSRGVRERMHEVQSIVAGLSSVTTLLAGGSIPDETRTRLQRAIDSEMSRLERLVTMKPAEHGMIDLDTVLDSVLGLHAARGRTVDWEPCGVRVLGRLDDVAEAVNILLENAATHGGGRGSKVVVQTDPLEETVRISVSDQGPGIPEDLRSQIFEWGVGRPDTPGQGIGLNLAQRLVHEQGGSITLGHPDTQGSTFVIRLPAARQSEENLRVGA